MSKLNQSGNQKNKNRENYAWINVFLAKKHDEN